MRAEVTVFNFSGIYDEESFYRADKGSSFCLNVLNFKDLQGTNCMCDDPAKEAIKKNVLKHICSRYRGDNRPSEEVILSDFAKSVHFIDSGNYHYMSALLLDMVKEPFSLIVIDHHPDMQPSMFGDVLSCGGWVKYVLDNNPFVRDVHIIGADVKLIDEIDLKDREKVHFYDRCTLPQTDFPFYLSIDKDVCAKSEFETNWDQGEFKADEVLNFTKALLAEKEALGIDVCGECSVGQEGIDLQRAIIQNDKFNMAILDAIFSR